ncbi:hypothetical protein U27_06260 [Candidatus Vecturithrix granuli]|uniref:DarT domain-containing protein n=1 Tax=Vecturithrix granuli TaxID=1499967 RepID=A0A081C3X8_VECG1|nr:hypothetical protein U27_06260 [Candidatus Vecturithrix granuli]
MDSLGEGLLQFLTTDPLKQIRRNVYQLLGASVDNVYVYYITHLANLNSILTDSGLKCREVIEDTTTDLSSHTVQEKRNISLKLARQITSRSEAIERNLHECINFFWNPLNDTFRAFQRNALILNPDEADNVYGIICILEMELSSLFESNKIYWCTSKKNLAVDNYWTYRFYNTLSWDRIFSLPNEDESNQYRSAEFIAYYENPGQRTSDLIPFNFITRILIPESKRREVETVVPSINHLLFPINKVNVFRPKHELLNAERHFIQGVANLQKQGISIEEFCELINEFANLSQVLGCTLTTEWFKHEYIAYSLHGVGHVTRVMFWVHILCYLIDVDESTKIAAQYAAFIHDFCRENQQEDHKHGIDAVTEFDKFLKQTQIPENLMDSCINAVIYHCKADNECQNQDILWQVLKDADALERGRFGNPQGVRNIRKESKGCNVSFLRSEISTSLKEQLAWSAYWLAVMCKHIVHHMYILEN